MCTVYLQINKTKSIIYTGFTLFKVYTTKNIDFALHVKDSDTPINVHFPYHYFAVGKT